MGTSGFDVRAAARRGEFRGSVADYTQYRLGLGEPPFLREIDR